MKYTFRQGVRKAFNAFGLDITRVTASPRVTLLGLKRFPIRSIIDVGANEGQFAMMVSEFFPSAHLYCFEPLPDPFKRLHRWAETRNGKVKVFNVALGEREGTVEMYSHLEHSPSSSLLRTTRHCEMVYPLTQKQTPVCVQLMPLDKLVVNLPDPLIPDLLIKLDTQGYEDRILRGGEETVRKARVCLSELSLDELYKQQATFKDIMTFLYDHGFHYAGNLDQVYGEDGHVISLDAVFVRQ